MTAFRSFRLLALVLTMGFAASLGLTGCAESDGDAPGLNGGGGGGGGPPITQGSCTLNGTPLCAIPEIGPAVIEGAGGMCPDDPGMLDGFQLCQIPGIGPPLAEAACGGPCPDAGGGGGGAPPASLEDLCSIPVLGPALVEGLGGACPDGGGGAGCIPDACDPGGNGCLSDLPGSEALICPP